MPAIDDAISTASEADEQSDLVVRAERCDRELFERLRHDVDDEAADRQNRAPAATEDEGEHLRDSEKDRRADDPRDHRPQPESDASAPACPTHTATPLRPDLPPS
jgi:hypothetical protein